MPWLTRGLRNGVLTTTYPRRPDAYADTFRGGVEVIAAPSADRDLPACPTDAISTDRDGTVRLDQGRCILCGRCVVEQPDRFRWRGGSAVASPLRPALTVPHAAEDAASLAQARSQLAARTRRFRRSLHVRHVDLGSDGTEEWEIAALSNPVYDIHRLGVFFTASPRHADLLLVTGAGVPGMAEPLRRTLEATARPVVIIAVGTDAVSGGLTGADGVGALVSVDVWVPGSPPSPFMILSGILLAIDRLPAAEVAP